MKTWQKWQDSQLLLQRKREAEAKLQFTNKPDKLQQAKDEIKEVRPCTAFIHYVNTGLESSSFSWRLKTELSYWADVHKKYISIL